MARIDLGAPLEVPGIETTFVIGHPTQYQPDPTRGVFSWLQHVQLEDSLVLTTTAGLSNCGCV